MIKLSENVFLTFVILLGLVAIGPNIDCKSLKSKRFASLFIADDTLWCGNGNIAKDCETLGFHKDADSCCRTHDYCPYTFSIIADSYNGFIMEGVLPLSHCECDLEFYECLHAKPYKRGSNYVWTSYKELNMKCFAYFPCDELSDLYDNIWEMDKKRHTGSCFNGFRVAVFNDTKDYSEFMNKKVTRVQKEIMADGLRTRRDQFMSEPKKKAECLSYFPNEHENIAKGLEKRFLQPEATTTTAATTPSKTTLDVDKKEKNDNTVVFFGYRFEYENFVLILITCSLIIPSIVFAVVMGVLKIQHALNKYVFIKNNMTDMQ